MKLAQNIKLMLQQKANEKKKAEEKKLTDRINSIKKNPGYGKLIEYLIIGFINNPDELKLCMPLGSFSVFIPLGSLSAFIPKEDALLVLEDEGFSVSEDENGLKVYLPDHL